MRWRARGVVVVVGALVAAATVAGCAGAGSPTGDDAETAAREAAAREYAAQFARDLGSHRDTIDDYARAAAERLAQGGRAILFAIERAPGAEHGDTFGSLSLLVADELGDGAGTAPDAGPFCFDVPLGYFGYTGRWDTTEGALPRECPATVEPVEIPVDTAVHEVVAENAAAAAVDVLERLGPVAPTAVEVEEAIAALLVAPAGAPAAPPRAIVVDDRIGVSMGDADGCVLVARVDGVTTEVSAAPARLQPGELGCAPETALADPDSLRSPH